MKKTALLIIDIQNDYFSGGRMELVGADKALHNAKKLLDCARTANLPVIFMHHVAEQEGAAFFLPNTQGVELHKELVPRENEVVMKKHFPNSFRETGLDELLQVKNISQLLICGMMSHMCVDATTRAAFDKGYDCVLAHDACATRDLQFFGKTIAAEDVHGAFMAALGARYAQVATSDECVKLLTGKDDGQ